MRTIVGIILGVLLVFPGVELLRWVSRSVYDATTYTDAALFMIVILLTVHVVRSRPRVVDHSRRASRDREAQDETPQLYHLQGPGAPETPRRRTPTRRRNTTRRRD
jgi:hypothetical protein